MSISSGTWIRVAIVATSLAWSLHAGMAIAAEEKKADATAMEEVLDILRAQGIIDEPTRERVLAKQVAQEKKQADVAGFIGGFEWFGDLRLRYESTFFDADALRNEMDNRYRLRYRARLGFTKKLNDRVSLGIRLASGASGTTGDPRATNVSLGEGNGDNFSPDGIFIDQAWLDVKIQDTGNFKLGFQAGKLANPYTGKNGLDLLVFDSDLSVEGGYLASQFRPSESSQIYATFGGFVIDEDAGTKDPKLIASQVGGQMALSDSVTLGGRLSAYQFRSLDQQFITVAMASGNTAGAFDERARLGEVFAFVDYKASDAWPIKLYGTAVQNFNADSFTFTQIVPMAGTATIRVDDEDLAWLLGFEVGNAKKLVLLGLALYHSEANAVVAPFTDSDVFDGFTNREGWVAYLGREIVKNVDFRLTYFDGHELEDDRVLVGTTLVSPFASSLSNADRRRVQADVIVKF
jgi:hypothetical protein